MSRAALYEGTVYHERRVTPARSFHVKVAMPLIDLEDLAALESLAPLWRSERRAPMSFRRADFFGDPSTPLATAVRDLVDARAGFRPEGPVRLLAHHRTWGWLFNPIALYYCYASDATTIEAVVADVTNIPWGESHAYIIDTRDGLADLAEQPKVLHVSPFLPMNLSYRFEVTVPGERCGFRVTVLRDSLEVFRAGFSLREHAMTRPELAKVLVRRVFATHRVSLGIYIQALRLWLRRARYYRHPTRAA